MASHKIGRNERCPCGSGLKYKRCCLASARQDAPEDVLRRKIVRAHDALGSQLLAFAQRTLDDRLLDEAWEEFHLWSEEHQRLHPDAFLPLFHDWLFYRFAPDPLEPRDEDVLVPEGTVVERFLGGPQGEHLPDLEQRILQAGRSRGNSLFLVRSVEATRLDLHDLLTDEELAVVDPEASASARTGMVVLGHLVPLDDMPYLAACAGLVLPETEQAAILEARAELAAPEGGALDPRALARLDLEIRDLYFDILDRTFAAQPGEPETQKPEATRALRPRPRPQLSLDL